MVIPMTTGMTMTMGTTIITTGTIIPTIMTTGTITIMTMATTITVTTMCISARALQVSRFRACRNSG